MVDPEDVSFVWEEAGFFVNLATYEEDGEAGLCSHMMRLYDCAPLSAMAVGLADCMSVPNEGDVETTEEHLVDHPADLEWDSKERRRCSKRYSLYDGWLEGGERR